MKAYLPAVIRIAERQRAQCDRLIQYCYDLDGTRLDVIEGPGPGDNLPYPQRNDAAFHEAAAKFAGRAFLWMEPDSIPTRAGWLKEITNDYRAVKTPFLLPDMAGAQRQDIAAGIGVYPPETSWLVPKKFERAAWDLWLTEHMVPLIGRTRLIQHSYGAYIAGKSVPHRFPRDNALLWPEAALFHRDIQQDIITLSGVAPLSTTPAATPIPDQPVMRHGGDLGDVIAALPVLRARGGGDIILFHDPNATEGKRSRESLEGARFEAIKPLLLAQPYVNSVEWGGEITTENFRETPRPPRESLVERQARHMGIWPINMRPWLFAPGSERHERVVVGRSARYHNPAGFPWAEVSAAFKDRLLFLGLPSEHEAFEALVDRKVDYAPTENLLDAAKIIAGAPMGFFNQSCLLWIAIGTGTRITVEVNPDVPNSSVPTNPRSFFAESVADLSQVRLALSKLS